MGNQEDRILEKIHQGRIGLIIIIHKIQDNMNTEILSSCLRDIFWKDIKMWSFYVNSDKKCAVATLCFTKKKMGDEVEQNYQACVDKLNVRKEWCEVHLTRRPHHDSYTNYNWIELESLTN